MSVTPACRLPTSIDKRRQLVVVVVVVTPKSILIVTCTFLGDPLWHHTICIYNWISSVIFVNSPWKFKKSKKYFLLQFFIGLARSRQLQKWNSNVQTLFLTWKVVFKKSDTFFLFLHKPFFWSFVQLQKILCSRLLPSFSFFGITKAPLSPSRVVRAEKKIFCQNSERKGISFMTFRTLLWHLEQLQWLCVCIYRNCSKYTTFFLALSDAN